MTPVLLCVLCALSHAPQLLQDMWQTDPETRPSAREVVARLEEMVMVVR